MTQQSVGFGRRNAVVQQPTHRDPPRTPKVHSLEGSGILPSRGGSVPSVGGGVGASDLSYPAPANAASEVEMMRFIDANWPKYRDVWLEMRTSGGPHLSWSFAAFFLGDFWLLYRKQYAIAFGLMAVKIALTFMGLDWVSWVLALGACIALGMYGKSIVVMRGMKTIGHVKALQLPQDLEVRRIEKAGGTSLFGPIMFIIVCVLAGIVAAGANQAGKLSKAKERVRATMQEQSMVTERRR